jgi:hypothetical protein
MLDRPVFDVRYVLAPGLPLSAAEVSAQPEEGFSNLKTFVLEGPADYGYGTQGMMMTALTHPRLRKVETLDLDVNLRDAEIREICGTVKAGHSQRC